MTQIDVRLGTPDDVAAAVSVYERSNLARRSHAATAPYPHPWQPGVARARARITLPLQNTGSGAWISDCMEENDDCRCRLPHLVAHI